MKFVARYRELLKVPQPDIGSVSVVDALQGVSTLLGDELAELNFTTDVVPPSLEVQADSQLLDQVLLNLVRNAIDAMQGAESPLLELGARLDYGRVVIKVTDNGCGIADESIEQIFVPFFTTKRDGSGIGLSLSRQIMTAHGGDIVVNSDTDGTTVSLVF